MQGFARRVFVNNAAAAAAATATADCTLSTCMQEEVEVGDLAKLRSCPTAEKAVEAASRFSLGLMQNVANRPWVRAISCACEQGHCSASWLLCCHPLPYEKPSHSQEMGQLHAYI